VLTSLVARDFRNLVSLDVHFASDGLAVVGDNGQGKTNLLEAIAYANLMRSMRGTRDVDVVRFGAPGSDVRVVAGGEAGCAVTIGIDRATRAKRVRIDGVEIRRLTDALGSIPSVLVSPSDVSLISGGPGERRRFLDILLALTDPSYLHALTRYRAALERRNGALRRGPGLVDADEVASWEPALVQHGAVLIAQRAAWVDRWAPEWATRCAALGERTAVAMTYRTSVGDSVSRDQSLAAEALGQALASRRASDIRRGLTQDGPHRDELVIELGARELRAFGSSGQQRTAAIALRMCEAGSWRARLGQAPLFLLDDPFAELDAGRARRILESFEAAGLGQVVLVVPRDEDIPEAFTRLERARMHEGILS
jgi:DNA replication and repair protein RecF